MSWWWWLVSPDWSKFETRPSYPASLEWLRKTGDNNIFAPFSRQVWPCQVVKQCGGHLWTRESKIFFGSMSQRERRRKKPCEYEKVKVFHMHWMLLTHLWLSGQGKSINLSVTFNACEMDTFKKVSSREVGLPSETCENQDRKNFIRSYLNKVV